MTMALSPQDLHRIAQSRGWRDGRVEVFDTASGKVTVKGLRDLHKHFEGVEPLAVALTAEPVPS